MIQLVKLMLSLGGGILVSTSVFAETEITETVDLDESAVVESQPLDEASVEANAGATESVKTNVVKAQEPSPSMPPTKVEALPEGAFLSSGQRVAIDGKGFSIVAPQGWVVQKDLPRSSLFVQAQVPATQYPRNISVVRFKDPKYISAISAQEFAERLVALFPQVSSTIEGYSLRSHESIKMADGREGWLFYTDFTDSGRKMMQAHVLVSSETNHYLATFTDVAEHFEGAVGGEEFLSEAWGAMTSIELDSPNPVQGLNMQLIIGGLIGLSLLIVFSTMARKFFAKRHYRAMSDSEELDVSEPDDVMTSSKLPVQTGRPVSAVSGISSLSATAELADENIDELVDQTVRSGFSRIIKFKSKAVDTTPDDEELEFDSDENSKRLKRGA